MKSSKQSQKTPATPPKPGKTSSPARPRRTNSQTAAKPARAPRASGTRRASVPTPPSAPLEIAAVHPSTPVQPPPKPPTKAAAPEPAAIPSPKPPKRVRLSRGKLPAVPAAQLPTILLEGEDAPGPLPSGPGQRFALGVGKTAPTGGAQPAMLPGAYGTRRLFVAARDPHWLHAYWDLSEDEARRYRSFARDGQLVLSVRRDAAGHEPPQRVAFPPAARSWFIQVGQADTEFVVELGYDDAGGSWQVVATAPAVKTPPEAMAAVGAVEFTTIPVDAPFGTILAKVEEIVQEAAGATAPPPAPAVRSTQPPTAAPVAPPPPVGIAPLVEVIGRLREEGFRDLPRPAEASVRVWTPAQERALAAVLRLDEGGRVWIGSQDLTAMVLARLGQPGVTAGGAVSGAAAPSPEVGGPLGVSSGALPTPPAPARGFWFNVNAELVIYGATEPDATLTVGGRPVPLRPDGTFSLRFALPDGEYALSAVAVAATGDDRRSAALEFSRRTTYQGDVATAPADPALNPPRAGSPG